jgi:hypothetical protein
VWKEVAVILADWICDDLSMKVILLFVAFGLAPFIPGLFGLLMADPAVHHFEIWRMQKTGDEKVALYLGWTNGFLVAGGVARQPLWECLDTITYQQAVSMIDKYSNDHPERWNATFTEGMLEALTVHGSTCEGKNPLATK